jgi:hypothetical protein
MAKTKVTTRFQILEFLDKFVDGATASAIGHTVVDQAKDMIASGQSPERGWGRFDKYSESYKSAIKGNSYPGKKVRPVNLNLTGEMLSGYSFRRVSDHVIEVGMTKGSAERKNIAEYHQEGTSRMPARPLVPHEGAEWAVSIMRAIRDVYGKRLRQLIERANKK